MPRNIPLRERKPKQRVEGDPARRAQTTAMFPPPATATPAFKEGYRECIELYALHAPDRRGVGRTLDTHCALLEEECLRSAMARDALARYEGYRQALKDLRQARRFR